MKYGRLLFLLLVSMFITQEAFSQFTASGTIIDVNGDPLIGVNVAIRGTTLGTTTDLDGNFTLSVSDNSTTLEISYIGYEAQQVEVSPPRRQRRLPQEPMPRLLSVQKGCHS